MRQCMIRMNKCFLSNEILYAPCFYCLSIPAFSNVYGCLYHIDPVNTLELGFNVIHSLAWVSWGSFSSPGNLAWMLLLTIEHPGYFYIYINIRYSDSMRRHFYYFSLLLLQTMDFWLFLLWNYSKSFRYGIVKHLKQTLLWTFVYSKIWFPCQTLPPFFFFDNDTTAFFLPLMGWCR